MLSVGLGTSAALAGQQKPTHTRVLSPNYNAQCVVGLSEASVLMMVYVCAYMSIMLIGRLSTLSWFFLAGHHIM